MMIIMQNLNEKLNDTLDFFLYCYSPLDFSLSTYYSEISVKYQILYDNFEFQLESLTTKTQNDIFSISHCLVYVDYDSAPL